MRHHLRIHFFMVEAKTALERGGMVRSDDGVRHRSEKGKSSRNTAHRARVPRQKAIQQKAREEVWDSTATLIGARTNKSLTV